MLLPVMLPVMGLDNFIAVVCYTYDSIDVVSYNNLSINVYDEHQRGIIFIVRGILLEICSYIFLFSNFPVNSDFSVFIQSWRLHYAQLCNWKTYLVIRCYLHLLYFCDQHIDMHVPNKFHFSSSSYNVVLLLVNLYLQVYCMWHYLQVPPSSYPLM